jgi:undecaprenyl-diphosphatase
VIEFLYSCDRAILLFINSTLSNPVGDWIWPWVTDYDKHWPVRIVLVAVWLWLMIRGGTRGRTVAIMIIPALVLFDQFSSAFLKELVGRPRPCYEVGGVPIVRGLHMLVQCGGGNSFPSSHAVNNFGIATILSHYYRRWTWVFVTCASIIALSRVAVGVHYPSDSVAGAVIGASLAAFVIWCWTKTQRRFFPSLSLRSFVPEQQ